MNVLGSVVIFSGLPLATPGVWSIVVVVTMVRIRLIPTSAVVVSAIVLVSIVIVVASVVVIVAVIVPTPIVIISPIIVFAFVIVFAAVVIFPVPVFCVSVLIIGAWPVAIPIGLSNTSV